MCPRHVDMQQLMQCTGDAVNESVRMLVENMAIRSQLFIMRGKTILVISAGCFSKNFIWRAASDYGIEARLTIICFILIVASLHCCLDFANLYYLCHS
jgi:hypothetical protein